MKLSKKLHKKLKDRQTNNALRILGTESNFVDFSSNDYLGFSKTEAIFDNTHQYLIDNGIKQNGSTGSRLLSGNHKLYTKVENMLCEFHESEATLIFNSGYDANIGLFSSVPQRGDIILYDEFIHASIRDGIKMSNAKAYKFKHNDLIHLDEILKRFLHEESDIYVVTESVFSMDGDSPDLVTMSQIIKKHKAFFIVDEAHAIGIFDGGLIQKNNLQNEVFARIITFGKALGCHGAAILGSKQLKQYLVNFARSFIYTTGLPPHSLVTIIVAYEHLVSSSGVKNSQKLHQNVEHFKSEIKRLNLNFKASNSAIHCCVISGNKNVRLIAQKLQEKGFDVKPILSPTITKGKERLRFCLHYYNSTKEITEVLENLATFVAR